MTTRSRAPRGTRTVAVPARPAAGVRGREQRADAAAPVAAQRHRVLPIALEPAGPLPAALTAALAEPGTAVARHPGLLAHDGPAAARAAEAFGAEAFTLGRHLVFGAGRYRPATSAGRDLLGHELAHAEEQALEGRLTVDRKKAPAPPDPYKPLKDRIAEESRGRFPGILGHLATLRLLQAVADAVEAHDLPGTKAAIAAFIARERDNPLDPASAVVLRDVPMVLVTRTFLLGLPAESQRLEAHFFRDRRHAYDQPTRGEGHQTRFAVLTSIVEAANRGARFDDLPMASAAIDTAVTVIEALINQAAQLDLQEVRRQRDEAAREAMSGLDVFRTHEDPGRTESAFYSGLMDLVAAMMPTVHRGLQVLMDQAVAEVESSSGTHTALTRAKAAVVRVRRAADGLDRIVLERKTRQKPGGPDPAFGLAGPLQSSVDVTRSDFARRQKRHLDYFIRTRKGPSVDIEAYDPKERSFAEKSTDVGRTIEVREQQIALLERLAGVAKDAAGKPVAESVRDAATLKSLSRFRLHNNDDWRQLLLAKFRDAKTASGDDWKALVATVGLLQDYLNAFTTHTPYNIDEFGDNYLTRTFPRAMTGQLIHDCGVYALRVAYMLSLVREELHLTFRAAIMPVHVGLVISFGDDVSKGALYVNNNTITVMPGRPSTLPGHKHDTSLSELAELWKSTDPKGRPRTPVALDAKAFHAEVVAATFVAGVDVPVRLVDVPSSPARTSAATDKRRLWDWYHDLIKSPATRPVKGTPRPELEYVAHLEMLRRMHNMIRVPAYMRAHQLFKAKERELRAAGADLRSNDAARRTRAQAVLRAHRDDLVKVFEPLSDARARAARDAAEISEFMRTHPQATGTGARLRPAARLNLTLDPDIDRYLGSPGSPGLLEQGDVVPAGWADPARLPRRSD